MAKRQPKDFNYQKPDDKDITDPAGADAIRAGKPVSVVYPKHLHKYAGEHNPYEYVVVNNEDEESDARAAGFKSAHEVDAEQRLAKKAAPASGKAKEPAAPAKAKRVPKAKKTAPASDAPPATE